MAQRLAAWGTKLVSKTTSGTLGKLCIDGRGARVCSTHLYFIWSPPPYGPIALSRAAQPHLQTFWSHARVELGPPTPSQWPAIKEGFSK